MMDILIAYFSPTGTTEQIARTIADEVQGDLFEIRPDRPYSEADLKWTNPLARCNREKLLKKAVRCSNRIQNFEKYRIVLIGFPIWYYAEPAIIDSFLKSYRWAGKEVYLFATSGGSDISRARKNIQAIIGGDVASAALLNKSSDILPWLDRLGI